MIEKLEYLLAIAQEKHFGRAAQACKVSQPSLSLGLKQLEEMLDVRLVRRGTRFIGLTAEGERMLEWARRIVGDARAMREDIRGLKQGLAGQLRIAVIPAALPMVATVTRLLHARYPDISFRILSRPSTTMTPLLDNLEIDAAITYVDVEPATRITTVPLYRERYQLVMARDFPGPKGDRTTWAEVAELPLCLLTPDTQNRQFIEALLRGAGGTPRITLESDSMTILFAHIREGLWASVMPEHLWRSTRMSKGFRVLSIAEPEVVHTIGLIMPVREPMSPLANALVTEARRVATRLMRREGAAT